MIEKSLCLYECFSSNNQSLMFECKNNTYRYSIIKLYSDSTCNTLVDLKTTKIYKKINNRIYK